MLELGTSFQRVLLPLLEHWVRTEGGIPAGETKPHLVMSGKLSRLQELTEQLEATGNIQQIKIARQQLETCVSLATQTANHPTQASPSRIKR